VPVVSGKNGGPVGGKERERVSALSVKCKAAIRVFDFGSRTFREAS
jgi:hypothetical protein